MEHIANVILDTIWYKNNVFLVRNQFLAVQNAMMMPANAHNAIK